MEHIVDVESNIGLVHMVAGKMRHLTYNGVVDYEDLVNDGIFGLAHAVDPDVRWFAVSHDGPATSIPQPRPTATVEVNAIDGHFT